MKKNLIYRWVPAIVLSVLIVTVPLASATFAQEKETTTYQHIGTEGATGEKMLADLCLVRPFGIVASAVGIAAFVVSLPFTLLGNNTPEASQKLVVDPVKFTFKRPLGEF
jgi:hypothetical protein